MKYMIAIYEAPEDFAARTDPGGQEGYWAGWTAYSEALRTAGVMSDGAALQPPETATVVRGEGAARRVEDGPFADAKEQLGGFFILDVENLDAAMSWASRCPAVKQGGVEIRPLLNAD